MNRMMIDPPDPMENLISNQSMAIVDRIVRNTVNLIYDRFDVAEITTKDGWLNVSKEQVINDCLNAAAGRDHPRTETTDVRYVYDVFQMLFKHLNDRLKAYDKLAWEQMMLKPIGTITVASTGAPKGDL